MSFKDIFRKIQNIIEKLKNKGFFHLILSSSLVKIVSFASALFLPRFLSKDEFGILGHADNIRNYLMLINGLGLANATLRYCAKDDDDEKKKGYFIATIAVGIAFDVIMILVSIIGFCVVPLPFPDTKPILLINSLLPLFAFLFEDIQLLLRATFENKKYSVLSFLYSLAMVVLQIGGAIIGGLYGVALGRYLAVIVCIFIGYNFIKGIDIMRKKAIIPDKETIKGMINFGIVMLIANATSLIMQLNENLIIAEVLKDKEAVGEYQLASYVLQISLFIVQSVIIFIFPYFVRHMDDKKWVWEKFKKVFFYNGIVMVPLHIILMFLVDPAVKIFYRGEYNGSIPIMQMLLLASLAQALFRGLAGNILAGIGEEKFNLKINIVFAVLHAVIDVWAITNFGIKGAAIALTVVYFLSGITMIARLRYVCKKAIKEEELMNN